MRVVLVAPAPFSAAGNDVDRGLQAMSSSPVAFFMENEILRRGLVLLNALMAAYCTTILLLLYGEQPCTQAANASFYCEPSAGTTRFGSTIRRIHTALGVYFAVTSWLLARPRQWVIRLNIIAFSGSGSALLAFGIQQCLEEDQGSLPKIVGIQLIVAGAMTGIAGGVSGWHYAKRLALETRVFMDFLIGSIPS